MRIACWIIQGTETPKNEIIIAFPRQQWLREHASMLRYTYNVSLVKNLVLGNFTTLCRHIPVFLQSLSDNGHLTFCAHPVRNRCMFICD